MEYNAGLFLELLSIKLGIRSHLFEYLRNVFLVIL
jgi:hypothetical protein